MKQKKSRTVAKIFMGITILSFLVTMVTAILWIFSSKIGLPVKYDYFMAALGITLIFSVVTFWIFLLSRIRKTEEEDCEEEPDTESAEIEIADSLVDPYTEQQKAVMKALAARRAQEKVREEKLKNVAKIAASVAGGFALGIAVAILVNHRKKD